MLARQHYHKNLILIDHEQNKGLGEARNTGLSKARGKYVWFIDSDDYIEKNCFQKLISEIEENQLEILNFNFYRLKDSSIEEYELNLNTETKTQKGTEFLIYLGKDYWKNASASRKIYKRDYLLSIKLRFPSYPFMEDQTFALRALLYSKRFKHIPSKFYYYRWNESSLLQGELTPAKRLAIFALFSDLFSVYREIKDNQPQLAEHIKEKAVYHFNNIFKSYLYFNHKDRKRAKSYILQNIDLIQENVNNKGWRKLLLKHLNTSVFFLFFTYPLLTLARDLKRSFFK